MSLDRCGGRTCRRACRAPGAHTAGGDADEVLGLLARDLDVTAAVDLATTVGGASARVLASVLGLA